MPTVIARFYAELNDGLPPPYRMRDHIRVLDPGATVHDLLVSAGITEGAVDLILVNGESSGAHRVLFTGDRVSIYPVFESFDISSLSRVRPVPLRDPRFVLDAHLGKLASQLRMLGFDAAYRNDFRDEELIRISREESRLLLSRDRLLMNTPGLERAHLIRETDPAMQLAEVLVRFDLRNSVAPFTRCIRCNTRLRPAPRDEALERLPPRVREHAYEFLVCPECHRVYWKGTHYERMKKFIETLLSRITPLQSHETS